MRLTRRASPTRARPLVFVRVNPNLIAKAVAVVMAPLISLVTFFSKTRRLRNEIRENLSLIQELDKDAILQEHSPAAMWLRGKVTIDVAKLTGQSLGNDKKPVPKTSVILGSICCIGLSYWTYYLNRNTFNWYSIITGVFAFLSSMLVYGSFLDREIIPPEDRVETSESADNSDDDPTETSHGEKEQSAEVTVRLAHPASGSTF
jgi:hypothetical protein